MAATPPKADSGEWEDLEEISLSLPTGNCFGSARVDWSAQKRTLATIPWGPSTDRLLLPRPRSQCSLDRFEPESTTDLKQERDQVVEATSGLHRALVLDHLRRQVYGDRADRGVSLSSVGLFFYGSSPLRVCTLSWPALATSVHSASISGHSLVHARPGYQPSDRGCRRDGR